MTHSHAHTGPDLSGPLHIRAEWSRGPRGVFRDSASERLDYWLAGSMRMTSVSSDGGRLLYLDLSRGCFCELCFHDRPDGSGGFTILRRVSQRYARQSFPKEQAIAVVEG